jgi:hypothetical protein
LFPSHFLHILDAALRDEIGRTEAGCELPDCEFAPIAIGDHQEPTTRGTHEQGSKLLLIFCHRSPFHFDTAKTPAPLANLSPSGADAIGFHISFSYCKITGTQIEDRATPFRVDTFRFTVAVSHRPE